MKELAPIREALLELEGLEGDVEQAKRKRAAAAARIWSELGEDVLSVLGRSISFYVEDVVGRGRLEHSLRQVVVGGRVTQDAVDLAVELGLLEPRHYYQATDLGVKLARAIKRADRASEVHEGGAS